MANIVISGREKLFRGKKIEELKELDTREFAKLLTARERRTVIRNFNVIEEFVKRGEKKKAKAKSIRTHNRSMVIVPSFVDWTIHVHNGNRFIPVKIVLEMLGHRLGEFALTRKFTKHGAAGVGATKSSAALSVK